ncbi:hypothetical protein PVAP13_6NG264532 [Panicum virgatum]|uniref:Uncharacterized protein n=1 Tax=Panicum virgatum TaxID=38727 RepID=A0A8T0R2Y9_PANVG|nr:hypothetical protein PVAP13_6NG264532 [Panicum virgatum]
MAAAACSGRPRLDPGWCRADPPLRPLDLPSWALGMPGAGCGDGGGGCPVAVAAGCCASRRRRRRPGAACVGGHGADGCRWRVCWAAARPGLWRLRRPISASPINGAFATAGVAGLRGCGGAHGRLAGRCGRAIGAGIYDAAASGTPLLPGAALPRRGSWMPVACPSPCGWPLAVRVHPSSGLAVASGRPLSVRGTPSPGLAAAGGWPLSLGVAAGGPRFLGAVCGGCRAGRRAHLRCGGRRLWVGKGWWRKPWFCLRIDDDDALGRRLPC